MSKNFLTFGTKCNLKPDALSKTLNILHPNFLFCRRDPQRAEARCYPQKKVNSDPERQELVAGATFANRTLGFVNAPSLLQLAVADCQDLAVDTTEYEENRRLLMDHFEAIGLEFVRPDGAFFLFPKSLGMDDVAFVREALKEKILVVPGSGFGRQGHFRLSYAVPKKQVEDSLPAWERLIQRLGTPQSGGEATQR